MSRIPVILLGQTEAISQGVIKALSPEFNGKYLNPAHVQIDVKSPKLTHFSRAFHPQHTSRCGRNPTGS